MMLVGSCSMNDLEFARKLQEEYDREAAVEISDNIEEPSSSSSGQSVNKYEKGTPCFGQSPVDPVLELTDPNPNIHELFLQFSAEYFWGRLAGIEVKWSPRMTLCAGLCVYEGRGGLCSVRLSLPLLKLRPRKDLVETLLHEMIHAYLFVTDNDRDHDGHGPNFQKHMHRINKATGANISIYHNFHKEVESHQQHWWRCNGPCQHRKPYFGYVKRAMNRAPSPQDFWWAEHQATCSGTYTKIREPEGYGQKKVSKNKGKAEKPDISQVQSMDIRAFIGKGNTLGTISSSSQKGDKKFSVKGSSNHGIEKTDNKGVNKSKFSSCGQQRVIVGGVLLHNVSSEDVSPLFSAIKATSEATNQPSVKETNQSPNYFDEWPEDDDETLWLMDTDVIESHGKPEMSKKHGDDEVIDLTQNDVKNTTRPLDDVKNKLLKSPATFPHVSSGKSAFLGSNEKKRAVQKGNTIDRFKFPKNFISVCEDGDFTDSRFTNSKKPKRKKKYIMDELDSNDGLWEEGSCSTGDGEGKQNRVSFANPQSQQENSRSEHSVTAFNHGVTVQTERDSNVEDATHKLASLSSSTFSPKVNTSIQNDQAPSTSYVSSKFSGQGYRLGNSESGSSFLAQIRKSVSESCTSLSNQESSNDTASRFIHLSPQLAQTTRIASKKRSSEEAFGKVDSDFSVLYSYQNNKKPTGTRSTNSEVQDSLDDNLQRRNGNGSSLVPCPVCSRMVTADGINTHLDECLLGT